MSYIIKNKIGWQFNTKISKIKVNQMTAISFIYRDIAGHLIKKNKRILRDISVRITKTLVSLKYFETDYPRNYFKIIIKSDLLITI